MTTLTVATTGRAKFLRLVLALDAVVTGANGLVYLAGAGLVSDLLGPDAGLLRGIGAFLLVYGAAVGLLAARGTVSQAGVKAVIGLNIAWTLGSVAAVITGMMEFTTIGAVWAIAQALVVGVFAELQIMGLRKLR
ncbi:hypothetical protein ACBI99_29600 [Nonomuraea sp. ATR24]|uniref:hypothetical protein n=1 Tax=Nonomuraea TaxID=83681 RepID=UPI001C5D3002|nr:hypothetical protein [Nonomuraea ceibae]